MKKVFFLLCISIAICFFCMSVFAEDVGMDVQMPDEYKDFLDAVHEKEAADIPDGLLSDNPQEVADAVSRMSSAEYLLSALFGVVLGESAHILPHVLVLMSLAVIASVASMMTSHLSPSGVRVFESLSHTVMFCAIGGVAVEVLADTRRFFASLTTLISAFVPLSASVYTMGGNVGTAVKSSTGLLLTLGVVEFISGVVVVPLFCFCLCMSFISGISSDISAVGMGASIKKVFLTSLGIICAILSLSLSSQTLIASKADNAAMRTARIFLGGIPVSGGVLSSSLGVLSSSIELIRGAVGVGGIIILILLLLPIFVELWLIRTVYGLLGSFCGISGLPHEQRLFSEVSELYGILEGVVLMCSLVFVVGASLVCRTLPAIGG